MSKENAGSKKTGKKETDKEVRVEKSTDRIAMTKGKLEVTVYQIEVEGYVADGWKIK